MATFHEVEVVGNLGKTPELQYTPKGAPVCKFNMAAQTGRGEYKGTIWFRITFFGPQAEAINANLATGDLVCVKGELEHEESGYPRIWKGKDDGQPHASFEIRGRVCQFLTLKGGDRPTKQTAEGEDWGEWKKEEGDDNKKLDVPF